MYCTPGPLNSILINTENAVPNKPENNANIKYQVPISLAFVDKNHLSFQIEIEDRNKVFFSLYEFPASLILSPSLLESSFSRPLLLSLIVEKK
jgi:hypothetical protein